MPDSSIHPNSWLSELARIKPAKWQWNRSIRAAVSIGLPLAVGMLSGAFAVGIWMGIAGLMIINGENNNSYRSRFKLIAICSSIGPLGCLVGYAGCLPWIWLVLLMAALAFICGIISSYGAPFSLASLQFLALAAVAIGRPEIGPFWQATLYYLAGAAFYALLLGIEALVVRVQPRRKMTADLIAALASLAQSRANALAAPEEHAKAHAAEADRQAVISQSNALYADVLGRLNRRAGRTSETDGIWATLQCCDNAFALILSGRLEAPLRQAAADLNRIAGAVLAGKKPATGAAVDDADPLGRAIQSIASAGLFSHSPFSPVPVTVNGTANTRHLHPGIVIDRLIPGKKTTHAAFILCLCVAISYAVHWVDNDSRWYWVPLTVAILVKPDYGSLFARSLLRAIGTLIGVVVGSLLLLLIPKGLLLVAAIALLAAFIPWASQRSYALLGMVITPLVLILIDLTVPGSITANYAVQRLVATTIGAGIVLVFGYFIWPRSHYREIAATFKQGRRSIADYLLAVAENPQTAGNRPSCAEVSKNRRLAYARLLDLRMYLQKMMADPPPTAEEARAWLPLVASAERICDRITAYSVKAAPQAETAALPQIKQLAAAIAKASGSLKQPVDETGLPEETAELIRSVQQELLYMHRLGQRQPATHAASAKSGR